ncbi:hypothetical protein V8G54_026797 [Vigna mungo]|uniref:Uncharacterized protein n=1 Tax=Vigna mungo TaxID=3915 RepID=A0AAQ3N082_VIGMU
MKSSRCFIVNMTFLLVLFIMTSDLCDADLCIMKTEARGPIYRLPCDNNQQCQVGCRNPNCGCAAVCIEHVCQCPHLTSTHTDTIKSPHLAPPPHHHQPPHQAPSPHHHSPLHNHQASQLRYHKSPPPPHASQLRYHKSPPPPHASQLRYHKSPPPPHASSN